MLDWKFFFRVAVGNVGSHGAPVNILYLSRLLSDEGVDDEILSRVIDDVRENVRSAEDKKTSVRQALERNGLSHVSERVMNELFLEPPCLRYGDIGMF